MDQTHGSLIDKIIHSSFRQRAIVVMLVGVAFAFGLTAYQQMSRNVYPEITIPVFTVVTENEAMAPEEIEMMITRPMESAMNGLPGVRRIRSQTTQGLSSVVVEFDIETDFWRARQFVTERMAQVTAQMPPGTDPPTLASATTRLGEIYDLVVEGDLPLTELREIAEWQVRYGILTVPGVADVVNTGGYVRQYRITVDPYRLKAYGVALCDVEEAVGSGNENAAGGFVSTGTTEYVVRGIGRFDFVEDVKNTVVAVRSGVPVFLRDVACVDEGTAIRRGIVSKDGKEAVLVRVVKQPTADTVQVVQGIERAVSDMRPTLPEGVRLVTVYDQTRLIEESLSSVTRALLMGAVLVVAVLFAFLGRLRATLIVALSLPLSVITAGLVMRQFGIGLNTMSLGGLAIAVGIMVDASIIMVENIHHHFHSGREALDAPQGKERTAQRAAMEVGRPIAFATLIIICVFLPLFLMGGIEGLLFRPLAVTVAAAMLVALVLSLTLTPILSLRLLRPREGSDAEGEVKLVRALKRSYVPALDYVLARRWPVIGITAGLVILMGFGLAVIGKNFMPSLDEGAWLISTTTPSETSLEENNRITGLIEDNLLHNRDVETVVRRNGRSERAVGCVLPVNSGELLVNLKPRNERELSADEALEHVREELAEIPGVAVAFNSPLQQKIDESLEGTPAPLQVKLFGPDISVLAAKGSQIAEVVRDTRGVADVKMAQVSGIPQLRIEIDREAAARHGVSVGAISEIVRLAVGGEELTQLWRDQRSYGVFVRFPEAMRDDPEAISNILVDTPAGAQIPLSQLAQVSQAEGPNVIWREAMNRRVSIDANLHGRDLAGVVADIKAGLEGVDLPNGYFVTFGGQYQYQQRATRSLLVASAVALTVVFMLLFIALRSASQATMILATVPSAFVGGVAALLITAETLNVSSAVGFIALFGIAIQNSLVLLSQTNGFIAEGHSKSEAIRLASARRLRPALMTAACAALGLLPILLSGGVGVEIERPLAIVMVGGLITSTLFTLLVLPAVYLAVERIGSEARSRSGEFFAAKPTARGLGAPDGV